MLINVEFFFCPRNAQKTVLKKLVLKTALSGVKSNFSRGRAWYNRDHGCSETGSNLARKWRVQSFNGGCNGRKNGRKKWSAWGQTVSKL